MTKAQRDELIAHAEEEAPNECCGYARGRDGELERTFRAQNPRRSPYGYELDSKSLLAANDFDDEGYQVAIYHSHPRSPAEPSQTDINLARLGDSDQPAFPGTLYLIVGVKDPEDDLRLWSIVGNDVQQVELEVTD